MWCRQCQQSVMAVVSPDDQIHCATCGSALREHEASGPHARLRRTDPPQGPPPRTGPKQAIDDWEAWELDEDLGHIARTLRVIPGPAQAPTLPEAVLADAAQPAQVLPLPILQRTDPPSGLGAAGEVQRRRRGMPRLAGLLSFLGVACLSCGAILWAASIVEARRELLDIGVRGTIAGGLCLLIGGALHVHAVRTARSARAARLDRQLFAARTAVGRRVDRQAK